MYVIQRKGVKTNSLYIQDHGEVVGWFGELGGVPLAERKAQGHAHTQTREAGGLHGHVCVTAGGYPWMGWPGKARGLLKQCAGWPQ